MRRNRAVAVFLTNGAKFFQPEMPDRVAHQPAAQGGPGAGVGTVEGEVGLVGTELVLVVGEVDPAVELHRGEDRVGDDPGADPVVPPLVGEEELVRRLVHEDGEAGEHRAHEDEGEQVAPPRVEPDRAADDEHHVEPHRQHGDGVAGVVDVPQGGTELGDGHAVGQQPLGGEHVGSCRRGRAPWWWPCVNITILHQVMQERNRPFTARSVLASALLGMDPPELPVAQLVRLTGLFGISANRARVALSRMVAAGEATTDGSGTYRLAGHLPRTPGAPVGQPRRVDGAVHGAVVAGRGRHQRELGRGPDGPAACPGLSPAWPSCAKGCGCVRTTWRYACPSDLGPDVELMTARPETPERLARAPVGPAGVGGPGRPAARRDWRR